MGKLINSSKHIAFCKAARPKEKHNYDSAKTFFLLEQADGSQVFHITQKPNVSGSKLKGSQKLQTFLEKKKFLPEKGFTVDKKAKIVIGKLWMEAGKYKMSIDIKANGGGKSTLMGVEFKKFGLGKFKAMYSKGPQTEDEIVEDVEIKELQSNAGGFLSNKKTESAVKILKKLNKMDLAELSANGGDEALLERALRNLKKYEDKGFIEYMLLRDHKDKWASLNAPNEQQVTEWIDAIENQLNTRPEDELGEVMDGESAALDDIADEDEEAEVKDAVMLELWFKNSTKKFNKAKKTHANALNSLWNDFDDQAKVSDLARVLTGGDILKLLNFQDSFGHQLTKLYDTFANVDTIGEIYTSRPIRANIPKFKEAIEDWGGSGSWDEKEIMTNRSRSFFDDANPSGESSFLWTVINGNPIKMAHEEVKPTCFGYSGNDVLKFEWSIPESLREKLDNNDIYNKLLREPIADVYRGIQVSISKALENCELLYQIKEANPGDTTLTENYLSAYDDYTKTIEDGNALFESKTEKIMIDSWTELVKMDKAMIKWNRSFYKEVALNTSGAVIGLVAAGTSMGNPVGIAMGIWGAVKAINKMAVATIRRYEKFEETYLISKGTYAEFKTNFKDWTVREGLTEAGSNFVGLIVGFPALGSTKSVMAELENCYGKSGSVLNACYGYSNNLTNLLNQMSEFSNIIENPADHGLSSGDVVKMNKNFEKMRRIVVKLIDDIDKQMTIVQKVREWAPPAISFLAEVRAHRPGALKAFDSALTATEFGLAFVTGAPDGAAEWVDLTNACVALGNEVVERYDEGHQ